jgi:hypothetical protein
MALPLRKIGTLAAVIVGSVLIGAAVFKAISTSAPRNLFGEFASGAWLKVVSIPFELCLGGWLILSVTKRAPLLVALGTFALFTAVNLRDIAIGTAKCGCFGDLPVTPWHAFAIDCTALLLLATSYLTLRRGEAFRSGTRAGLLQFAAYQAVLVLGWSAYVAAQYGSSELALASLAGDDLAVRPGQVDFGTATAGALVPHAITVHNLSAGPITLLGGTADCSCVTTADMPVTIPPGESRAVGITLKLPAEAGSFRREAYLFTDSPAHKTLVIELTGRASLPAE